MRHGLGTLRPSRNKNRVVFSLKSTRRFVEYRYPERRQLQYEREETYHTGRAKLRLQNVRHDADSTRTLSGSGLRLVVPGLVRRGDESRRALHPCAYEGIIHDGANERGFNQRTTSISYGQLTTPSLLSRLQSRQVQMACFQTGRKLLQQLQVASMDGMDSPWDSRSRTRPI